MNRGTVYEIDLIQLKETLYCSK